ncbi:MAG: PIG-L deacetylase family protein [bacterium]
MKIMAVMAHPDDAEVWAGGTLAKFTDMGHQAHIVVMTYDPQHHRGREALEGARRLGCSIDLMGMPDTGVRDTDQAADKLVQILGKQTPQILVVHNPDDTHPDHEASFLVARRALIRWYSGAQRPKIIPSIFAANTYRGMGLRGPVELDTFVEIYELWERKANALLAHQSQNPQAWIPRQKAMLEVLGARSGCQMAEGFRRLVLFGEPGCVPHLDPSLLTARNPSQE